ncbi:GDSL-type esterase/lipase family protein [Luteolibacter flavescens]|uniref:GDSL-type esterase/lipase family protein n=1 Tax=Luteolibacter flavescens TaxID=1859460 RepID=A0ABT3FSZ1_9BACT|nr:GDSL-type esterase/lipase family protein [Luteolibacter flavescens]MCW1886667.1 GDSL-type esterase/lipase family protein [Luteolibacter flavescens]
MKPYAISWRQLLAPVAILSCSILAAAPPMRILPMGDSITEGSGGLNYRAPLRTLLTNAGYEVDYVGTYTANPGPLTDREHEGHSGWTIREIDAKVETWLAAIEDPDFVLLHIGTNDFGRRDDMANAIQRLDALVLKIATRRPHANIIVTNLMERGEPENGWIVAQFNPLVQGIVANHVAAGRKVHFLDMRSQVPLSDMPDQLHPNATGLGKMANAWFETIDSLSTPEGDFIAPKIARVRGSVSRTEVAVTFSKPVADSAADLANFSIDNGLTITSATLDASKRKVTLVTSPQTEGASYTVTVNNVTDLQTPAQPIAPGTTATFMSPLPRGYQNHVSESDQYSLVYSLDIPANAAYRQRQPVYQVDNRAATGPFDRVAYYMELLGESGDLHYVWTSMDAFTQDAGKIAVPTYASGGFFQQGVTNLNVASNVPGVAPANGVAGNIEFWPNSYERANSANVGGASGTLYDFGDQPIAGDYGSMQVHHTGMLKTVFAFNNWGGPTTESRTVDIGIGNNPSPVNGGIDWTFSNNGSAYTVRTLQVLVRTSGDHVAPTVASAIAAAGRSQVVVNFSEPLAAESVTAQGFTLSNGVKVLSAKLSEDRRAVTLQTTVQPSATPLTLTVGGVRDSSANANAIAPGTTFPVSTNTLPPEIAANIGAAANGYQLVLSSDLPVTGNFVAGSPYKYDDRGAPGTFTKVAYYLQLEQAGQPTRYVWAAMDAFTSGRKHVGVPTSASGAIYQQNVTNLQVISNQPGVVNGTTATGGNIEFWPHTYERANALNVPNASGSTFDTGDTRTTGLYGSMQIHNHDTGANQTVLALNRFAEDGNILDIGIGNCPSPIEGGADWTFAANAGNYTKRTLHVLVLPGTTTAADVVTKAPEAAGYQLAYSVDIPATGNMQGGAGAFNYEVNRAGQIGDFTRIGYFMELQKAGDPAPSYVWTSMDAFTKDPARIAVPTGWKFQQPVSNLNVVSNVAGVVNNTNIATGNIEFWPSNYNEQNTSNVPGANGGAFDFGDGNSNTTQGYGSMQVHNYGAAQTIFAFNRWGSSSHNGPLCLGIGNGPAPSTDWTFADNSASWGVKRLLQVYILPGNSDVTPPAITEIKPSVNGDSVRIVFSEAIAEGTAVVTIPGLTVHGVTQQGDNVLLVRTSPQTPGTAYTASITGVTDRSPAANGAPLSAAFTGYTRPAVFSNIPETDGYRHMLSLNLPGAVPVYNVNGVNYQVDERKFGDLPFDRVAYLMELDGNWAYASFDKHTSQLSQIGVPIVQTNPAPIQQIVTRMNVASNVASIATGNDIATGNIEFWAGNYTAVNQAGVPGASSTAFDFGDQMTSGGHGCLQIHNFGAAQTVMAFNNWGSNTTGNSEMGIGNHTASPQGALDWTLSGNANSYTTRRLHVLVRRDETASASFQAEPGTKSVAAGSDATFTIRVAGPGPYTYQWRHNGTGIEGATMPWLDVTDATGANSGTYDVVVTGPGGIQTVSPAGTLIVTGTVLQPTEIQLTGAGTANLTFYGDPGRTYEIHRSTDLVTWEPLDEATAAANGEMPVLDEDAPEPKAFYRAVPVN